MVKRKKIFFIIPSLRAGGAERIMSFIAQHLDCSKFEVKLIVLGFEKDSVYLLKNIDLVYFNKNRLLKSVRVLFATIY